MTTTHTTASGRLVRPASRTRIGIYIGGVLALSTLGGLAAARADGKPEESPGMLLFIVSPILVAAALRWFGGDGWGDAGLRLRLRGNGGWYALALGLFPALSAVAIGFGVLTGDVAFAEGAAERFAVLLLGALVVRTLFAAFEEFGWRGYLEPRLAALGVPAARRHLLVAAVWAVWHVPYILVADMMTTLPLAAYLPLFALAIVPMAFMYGVMRERTGSVWPAVIMHGVSNAVAFALLDATVVEDGAGWVASARPEGLVMLVALTAVAVIVWRRASPSATRR